VVLSAGIVMFAKRIRPPKKKYWNCRFSMETVGLIHFGNSDGDNCRIGMGVGGSGGMPAPG